MLNLLQKSLKQNFKMEGINGQWTASSENGSLIKVGHGAHDLDR